MQGILAQAEDRIHRIGQKAAAVNIHYLVGGASGVDGEMWSLVARKLETIYTALDAGSTSGVEVEGGELAVDEVPDISGVATDIGIDDNDIDVDMVSAGVKTGVGEAPGFGKGVREPRAGAREFFSSGAQGQGVQVNLLQHFKRDGGGASTSGGGERGSSSLARSTSLAFPTTVNTGTTGVPLPAGRVGASTSATPTVFHSTSTTVPQLHTAANPAALGSISGSATGVSRIDSGTTAHTAASACGIAATRAGATAPPTSAIAIAPIGVTDLTVDEFGEDFDASAWDAIDAAVLQSRTGSAQREPGATATATRNATDDGTVVIDD